MDSLQESLEEPLLMNGKQDERKNDVTPYATANILSRLIFSWMNPLLTLGYSKAIELDEIPQLAGADSGQSSYSKFNSYLQSPNTEIPISKAAFLFSLKDILVIGLYSLISSLASYVGPYTIDIFVDSLAQKKSATQAFILAWVFLGSELLESLINCQNDFKMVQAFLRIRAALTATIYRKALLLSNRSRQQCSSGEIANYISVDAQRIADFVYLNGLWLFPLEVFLGVWILYKKLGVVAFASFGSAVAVMVLNFPIGSLEEKLQKGMMDAKDARVRATMEILKNMKILKLQSWESRFLRKIEQLRETECNWIKKFLYTLAFSILIFMGAPVFVSVITFGTCFLFGVPLTAGKIVSTLATLGVLQGPIYAIPEMISQLVQIKVSLGRVSKFMQLEELQPDAVSYVSKVSTDAAIQIQNGKFSWNSDFNSPVLLDLNINIVKGMRVAVCGIVGSGKSSFLSCILGDVPKISGTVKVSGSRAYVPQSPWIPTGKIRDTILFGKEMDSFRYDQVLEACALKQDLAVLPNGDLTIVGERGINLSGGQKQRIQLARALYQDCDIYLLDDPFSALDAHTRSHIFKECIFGLLSSKTVVYVTHQMEFLPAADMILVMRDGAIAETGKFDEIRDATGDFARLVGEQWKSLNSIQGTVKNDKRSEGQEDCNRDNQEDSSKHEIETNVTEFTEKNKIAQIVQEEEREKGRVSFAVYLSYLTAVYKGRLIPIILVAQALFQLLRIASNYWLVLVVPAIQKVRQHFSNSQVIEIYVALALSSSVAIFITTMLLSIVAYKTANLLFGKMHKAIFHAPMSFFDATPTGRILSRASSDQNALEFGIPFGIGWLALSVINLLGTIVVMCQASWQVLFVFVPAAAGCIWYQQYYLPTSRELNRLREVSRGPFIQHYSESIAGSSVIRSFGYENQFMEKNIELTNSFLKCIFHSTAASRWLSFRMNFLSNLVFACFLLFLVSFSGVIPPSMAGLAVVYGLRMSGQLSSVIWSLCNVENSMVSVERILQYSDIPSEAPLIVNEYRASSDWPDQGTIEIINLQVRYRPHLPLVLKDITCTFPGGMKVGIVGRTGSGKSTLIQALFRIVEPESGRILIDHVDISKMGLFDLRSRLSIVPQDPTMFEGTVRSNLDPLEQYSDHQIWEVLDRCQLGNIIRSKEEKLDSSVTENGENWSAGQSQLICLGRALLKQSKILVLDEATASVDTETDSIIQEMIRTQFSQCTLLTIAHRITSVIHSDLVLVLKDGEIEEYEVPSKLLENESSAFAKLVMSSLQHESSVPVKANVLPTIKPYPWPLLFAYSLHLFMFFFNFFF